MSENAPPSRNPANDGDLTGMIKEILGKFLQNLDDCLPAKVIAVSADRTRVQVQPMVQMVTTLGERVSRAQLLEIPVFQAGGGGFVLSFPVKAGDLGWIKATDRDISLFLKSYAEVPPNTVRRHVFSDAWFVPDVMHGFTVADPEAAVLQSLDGTVAVALKPDGIKLTVGPAVLELTATGAACNVPFTASAGIITTTVEASGAITSLGVITGAELAVPGSPNYTAHHHDTTNVAAGTATRSSGGPL